ncbi:phosphate ABC transporter permease [Myxacorys almedinensis]|uniref:phosphate ABC transporter permease n=1 Tax=Myxacorys almedinensis TaxID=2651157 RepID=UPI00192EB9FD|nr:phosphate ABC transporter permease [Myxacorys almedinensis]
MLIPVSRKKFEDLIPLVATGAQYKYCWGRFPDFLRRILISISALASILLIRAVFGSGEFQDSLQSVTFFMGLFALVYWLWSPVLQASLRNYAYRRFKFAGFLQGEVLDVYITEELIGTQESANSRGELVVVENRERRINLEVGDESGFTTVLQVPIRQEHRGILPGDIAELLVVSSRPDLGRIAKVSDIFIPHSGIWVSDYPYLRRDEFEAVSRQLESAGYVEADEEYDEPQRKPSRPSYNEAPRTRSVRLASDPDDGGDIVPRRSSSYEPFEPSDDFGRSAPPRPRKRIPKTGANGNQVYRRDRRDEKHGN